jgi:hypothetical protein
MNRFSVLHTRKCRNLIKSSRVRRQGMAENLDKLWRELSWLATIENDPQKLSQLTVELEKRKRLIETAGPKNRI